MKIDGFLATMAGAVALAIVAPSIGAGGGPVPFDAITDAGIALVFFLHGANLSRQTLLQGTANWRLHLFVQAATFVLFPVLGLTIYFAFAPILPHDLRLGVFFLCAICSTISSSVAMVAIARGNIAAAVFDASLSGLIGMVLTPVLISLVHAQGGGGAPLLSSVLDIALKLLAPFLLGHLVRPLLIGFIARWKPWISKLDRAVIILIVYTAFCQSTHDGVWSKFSVATIAGVALLVGVLLLAILALTTLLARRLGFSTEDEITAVFCGSKKSLANGAPIAKVLFGASPALGAILLPLMLYHQLQLIACSLVAKRYASRPLAPAPSNVDLETAIQAASGNGAMT